MAIKLTATLGSDTFSGEDGADDPASVLTAFHDWIAARTPGTTGSNSAQLDRIEGKINAMADELATLNTTVGKLVTDIDAAIADGQAASTDLHTQLDAAKASLQAAVDADNIDKATAADLQAKLDALTSGVVDVTNALQAADVKVTTAAANLNPPVVLPTPPDPLPLV